MFEEFSAAFEQHGVAVKPTVKVPFANGKFTFKNVANCDDAIHAAKTAEELSWSGKAFCPKTGKECTASYKELPPLVTSKVLASESGVGE